VIIDVAAQLTSSAACSHESVKVASVTGLRVARFEIDVSRESETQFTSIVEE
jgi:hypothetical protein